MRACVIVLVCACGGAAKTTPPPAPPKKPPPAPALSVERICNRFAELRAENCGNFAQLQVTLDECPAVFRSVIDHPVSKEQRNLHDIGTCMANEGTCAEVLTCISKVDYEDPNDLRACTDPSDNRAVGMPPAEYAHRNGADAKRYSQTHSSKDAPIEMCGISGGIKWLQEMTCDDGSHPIRTTDDAERVRAGNVGSGGRCHSIIDLYKVKCPENSYDVYLDGYVCPLPQ